MLRKTKRRIYVSTISFITFLFIFALTSINPPCKHCSQPLHETIG
ncbi:MAG: hypothetical protein ACXWL2_01385 [Candidatus Chromulinivorax sp.]